jgi:glycosyltransferase involved in cell wall biosynthesis
MKILVVSESPLQRFGNQYYAVDPWVRFIQHLATAGDVTLVAPVRSVTVPTSDAWRLDPGALVIDHHDFYESYAGFARLWWRRRWQWARKFRRLAARHDVVLIRLPSPSLGLVMRAAGRVGTPAVLLVAGDMLAQSDRLIGSSGLRRRLYLAIMHRLVRQEVAWGRRAAAVFAYSSELAERHAGARVHMMRTPHLLRQDIRLRDDACTSATVRVLRVAWLIPSKGIETLIDAAARLMAKGVPISLRIVGKERVSGYQATLEQRATSLGIREAIQFVGWVPFDRMAAVYDDSDIQVISSLAEGTPRCIVEGMARGVPLVSTNVGGCKDVLEDGTDAVLVEPGDATALADAIARVIDDRDLRLRLISHGYQMAEAATFETRGAAFLRELRQIVGETTS